MSISAFNPRSTAFFDDFLPGADVEKHVSVIQIHPVSATSSCDDLSSTVSSTTRWSTEGTQIITPPNGQQRWLGAKQLLSQALELLQGDVVEQTQGENFDDEDLRLELQELALSVQKQFTSPHETIQTILQAHHVEAALRYAVHNDIAEHVPVHGSISYHDLAAKASIDSFQCKRILRLLSSYHLFAEDIHKKIIHTPASRYLLEQDMQAWIEYSTTDSITGSLCLSDALSKWPSSRDPTETGFSLSHNTNLPMFEYFSQTPGKLDRFRHAMTGMSRNIASSPLHAAQGYDWASLTAGAQVIDVGGGNGHVSRAIAESYPALKVTLQDIGVNFDHTKEGITYSKYDFFESQPIRHAEVYLMRQVLHDWSDDFAVKIIRNQVSAMASHSRIIVMDMVMPEPGDWRLAEERRARATDVTMLTLFNSEERNLVRWTEVMRKADNRLHLTGIVRPAGSILSLMEFSL